MLNRRLARAREEICDNYVLSCVEPVDYGETLLRLGQLLPPRQFFATAVGMFNTDWKLEDRIAGLLDERRTAMIRLHPLHNAAIAFSVLLLSLGMSHSHVALAQKTKPRVAASAPKAALSGLEYVPADATAIASIRPAAIFSHPKLRPVAKMLTDGISPSSQTSPAGIEYQNIARVTVVAFPVATRDAQDSVGLILQARKPIDKNKLLQNLAADAEQKEANGTTYYHSHPSENIHRFVYLPNARTVVFANQEENFWRLVKAGPQGARSAAWARGWNDSKDAHLAVVGNIPQLKSYLNKATAGVPQEALMGLRPLWTVGTDATVSLTLDDHLKLTGSYACGNAEDVPKVKGALQAVVAMAKAGLAAQQKLPRANRTPQPALLFGEVASQLLSTIKIERDGTLVRVQSVLTAEATDKAIARTTLAGVAAKSSARRMQSANNLKQLGLAMHNYHDKHGHFPPPTIVGPDGKTVHSWRVALLPYLDQQELYDAYRKDEPWDSPHNKKLVEKMPPTLRHPSVEAKSSDTSYFVLTGKDTAFLGTKGTPYADIRDGLSNTILVVESQRKVPWTKPQDVPYVATKQLPKFGGFEPDGFNAGFADGSVRFLSKDIVPKKLRAMITIDGGEIIDNQP